MRTLRSAVRRPARLAVVPAAIAAALLLSASLSPAAPRDAERHAGRAARSDAAMPVAPAAPVVKEILPNGLTLLMQEDHSKPLVGVCIFVNGGSRTEDPKLSGLSHYYEHLIFRGGSARRAAATRRTTTPATDSPPPRRTWTRRSGARWTPGSR